MGAEGHVVYDGASTSTIPMSTSAPELSMTDFVDIVHQSGIPKATKIRQVKQRPEYHPAFDFYKPVREATADTHRQGGTKAQFIALAGAVSDPKKQANYPSVIKGYSKWWGSKSLTWFNPPRHEHVGSNVRVVVNPEIGLTWAAEKHVIKLHFKEARLDRYRIALILDLMEYVLRPKVDVDVTMSVLDVRASKLHSRGGGPLTNIPLVEAELAYIAHLWPRV